VETELKFSARTGTPALTLPADVDVRFRAISSADPDTWSSAMLSSAAARAVGAGQLTVAAELYGPTGDLDLLWRVDQNAAGSVQIFATSPVDCQLEATIASVTGV
jgi:hypothetical protein